MSFKCPNKSFRSNPSQELSDWDLLVNKIGVRQAYAEYISNGEDIPDYRNYTDTFKGVNATLKIINALDSERANELYKRFYSKGNTEKFYQELTVLAGKRQVELLKEYNTTNNPKSIADMISGILSEMSYTVEIETAKSKVNLKQLPSEEDGYKIGDDIYKRNVTPEFEYIHYKNGNIISEEEFNSVVLEKNAQYYSNLTVPGGTNYTENEIATPLIVPSIKGHAQFSTDNGIGWFRGDEKLDNAEDYTYDDYEYDENGNPSKVTVPMMVGGTKTKTRRILEVQSDLFQKGRDKSKLTKDNLYLKSFKLNNDTYSIEEIFFKRNENTITENKYFKNNDEISHYQYGLAAEKYQETAPDSGNNFLQLLNKDNNWVAFFVKSIIQDSAKKGYEKVLFPSGNTASKVEGHTTLEDFKKQKEDRIKELEKDFKNLETSINTKIHYRTNEDISNDSFALNKIIEQKERKITEINQLKQELERVENEGFGALKPIYNFYQTTVTNILKKQGFNPTVITDEYGNTWNEVVVNPEDISKVIYLDRLQSLSTGKAAELTKEEKEWFKERFPNIPVETVKGLIDNQSLGRFISNGRILLSNEATTNTLRHEAWHVISQLYLTKNEVKELYDEVRSKLKNKKLTDLEAEEILAEDFANYKDTGVILGNRPNTESLFKKILNFLKSIVGLNTTQVKDIYNKLETGYYTSKPQIGTTKFTSLDRTFKTAFPDGNKPNEKFTKDVLDGIDYEFFNILFGSNFTPEKLFQSSKLSPEVYDRVRDIFIDKYDQAIESGNNILSSNFEYILENWDEVLDLHNNRIKALGVSLVKGENEKTGEVEAGKELNEDLDVISDESINEDEQDSYDASDPNFRAANIVSTKDLMYKQTKLLIATLPKVYANEQPILNDLGLATLVDFNSEYNFLLKNLAGLSDYPSMVNKIKELSLSKPELKVLLKRIKESGDSLSSDQVILQNQFRQDFDKNQAISYKTIIKADGVIYVIDATRENTADKVKEIWRNNLINTNGISISGESRITTTKEHLEFKDNIDFLSKIGITFSKETLPALKNNEDFGKAVLGIESYIKKNNYDLTDLYTKDSGAKGNINTILDLEAKYTPNVTELSFISTEGKTVYSISLNNGLSIIKNIINNSKDKADLFSKLPHLDSIYTQNSVWLNQMFDSAGKKKPGININLDLFDGLSTQDTEEKASKQTTKLSKGDKYVQDLNNLLLQGKTAYIRASDKSTEHSFSLSNYGGNQILPVSIEALKDTVDIYRVKEIFRGYFKDELQSIYEYEVNGVGKDIDIYGSNLDKDGNRVDGNASKWRVFKDFPNTDVIKKTVNDKIKELKVSDKTSSEKQIEINALYKSLEKSIDNTVVEFLDKYTNELIKEYAKYGITKENGLGISKELKEKYTHEQLFRALAVNDFINSVEQIKLFIGDLAYYRDLFKRTSAFTGVKKTVRYDQDWWNWLNINKPRFDKKLSNGKINVFVYEDSNQKSNYFKEYFDALIASNISEDLANKVLKSYNDMDEADAQGYITLDEYREFFNGAGEQFSEAQYQYELNLMKMDKGLEYDKSIIAKGNPGYYFMPIKAQYAGPQDNVGDLYAPAFHKYSLMPLQYSLVKGRNLEGLLDNMIKNQAGYSVFKSGSKVGTRVNDKGRANKFYTKTISGEINNDNLQVQTIDYKFLGIQLDISPKLKEKVIFGTQFRKLLFSNLFEGGVEQMDKSKELFDEYSNIFRDLIATEKAKLIKELGLDPANNYKTKDVTKLVKLLQEESIDRNLADNIIDALQTEEIDGKIELKYKFDSMPNKDKVNSMIMSLVNSRLIKQMMNGDAMIQGASTGFELKGKRVEGSSDLKFYRKSEDKKTLPMQIKVPLTGEYKGWIEKFGSIENINKALKDNKIDKNLITWVGYRIPTQGLNSIEFMEIEEFLTEDAGNLIILPTEIVAKSGGDFDIDKLNIFRPWLNPSNDTQKKQNRIIDIAKEILEQDFNFNALITPNSTALLTDIVEELRYIEFLNDKKLTDEEQYESYRKKQGADLTLNRKEVREKLIKEKAKSFKKETTENIRYTNQLKLNIKVDQFAKFLGGKAGVGIGAIHNTHHILSQIANLSINNEYTDDTGQKKPVNIFFKHNKTKDGLIDISKVKDVAGNNNISEVISQIINASVDIAKDPFMFDLNMDLSTLSTYLYLARTGVEFEQIAYFMKQPIISEFLIESSKNKSVFLKASGKSISDKDIISGKDGSEEKYKKRLQDKLKLTDDEFDTYIDGIEPRYDITTSELKSYLTTTNQDSVAYLHAQLQLIKDFQNYKTQAGLLSDAINSVNHDTAGLGSNINSSRNKEQQKQRVKRTAFVNNIDNIYKDTFVGSFDQHQFTVDAYEQFYHTQTPEIVENNRYLLDRLSSKYTTELDRNRLYSLIENDFINYVVQNYGFDGEISSVVNNLFRGQESVAIKLLRLKRRDNLSVEESKLADNLLLKELYPMLADKKQHPTTDNVRIYSKKFDTFTSNQLTQSFIELQEADPLLAKQLMDLGILQSGLNNSAITYVGIIPFEYYGDLVNKSFEEFNKKNGAQDIYKFNQLFVRNNSKSPLVSGAAKNMFLGEGVINPKSLEFAIASGVSVRRRESKELDKNGNPKIISYYDNSIGNGMYGKNYDINEYRINLTELKPKKEEEVDLFVQDNNSETESLPSIVENDKNDIEDETEEVEIKKQVPKFKPANKEQIDAIASIKDFIDNGKSGEWFTLEGKAGTGKTTIIGEVLKPYFGQYKNIIIGALSHKAKLVLTEKIKNLYPNGNFRSETIASMLGMTMDPETGKFKKPESSVSSWGFSESTPISLGDIVIIDEASMISKEALKLIMEDKNPLAKVVFLGDIGQLPPIEEDGSELPSKVFETKNKSKLLERVRQGESSPILPYADYFWDNSQSSKPVEYPAPSEKEVDTVTSKGSLVFVNKISDILNTIIEEFKSSVFNNNPNNIKVVSYRNDARKFLNNKIREEVFGEKSKEQFVEGDLIMFTNNYQISKDKSISNSYETQVNSLEKEVYNGFNTFKISFNDEESVDPKKPSQVYVRVLSNEDLVKFNNQLALLRDNALSKPKKSREAAAAWREFYKLKGMFAPIDYGYAITSHKSQGSTYNTVIVDSQDIMSVKPISAKTKSQSIYTALTRARNTTIVVNGKNETNLNNVQTALMFGDKEFQDKMANTQPKVDNKNNDDNNLDNIEEGGIFVVDDKKTSDIKEYTVKQQLKDSEFLRYSKSNDYFVVKMNYLGEARKLKSDLNNNGELIREETRGNKKVFIINDQIKIRFNNTKASPVVSKISKSKFKFEQEVYFKIREDIVNYKFSKEVEEELISDLNNVDSDESLGRLIKKICNI